VLYIGGGSSDFCVSQRADFVLAKPKLAAYCAQRGIAHAPFAHFGEASARLAALLEPRA
jgi:2-hydroxy-3-keto-5-methylthiopentenyl-1-phosphate phosphatase